MMGRTDCAPDPAGVADCLRQVEGLAVEHVLHSGLSRAEVPARQLAEARHLPLVCDPRWREIDFGDWDGKFAADIDADAFTRFHDDPDANAPPGGERWSALVARVGAAIADLPRAPVLVVTHGGAMRAALAVLCGFALPQCWVVDLPYAALLSLRVWPGDHVAGQIIGLRT
ncbi:MAG: histidine phosphatase family protein, partial [Sphingobium sp.]